MENFLNLQLGYAETLAKTTGHIACITDKDTVIAVSGGSKKEFLEQDLSGELEQLLEDKEVYTSKENNEISIPITKNDNKERKFNSQVVYPIISRGRCNRKCYIIIKRCKHKNGRVRTKSCSISSWFPKQPNGNIEPQKSKNFTCFFSYTVI